MTRPIVSWAGSNLVRTTGVRRTVCALCKTPLETGGWAWLAEVPNKRLARDGRVTTFIVHELWCDSCERKRAAS